MDKIKQLLTNDFERDLLDAAMVSLEDKGNKLCYNNFAYAIRELSRHFLHNLSPEANVGNCPWFRPETSNGKPTRAQRVRYAIQGGISDDILEKWGFAVEELHDVIRDVKENIDMLSKYTHINPEVFNINEAEIAEKSNAVLTAFVSLVETIDGYRDDLKAFLDGYIEDHVIESVITNSFVNIDSLAPHYSLEGADVSEYHVCEINAYEIVVEVYGDVYVTLEYGSRQERREGDGLDIPQSFSFATKIYYEINEDFPSGNYNVDDYDVDTSSWYERAGEDDDF